MGPYPREVATEPNGVEIVFGTESQDLAANGCVREGGICRE